MRVVYEHLSELFFINHRAGKWTGPGTWSKAEATPSFSHPDKLLCFIGDKRGFVWFVFCNVFFFPCFDESH